MVSELPDEIVLKLNKLEQWIIFLFGVIFGASITIIILKTLGVF